MSGQQHASARVSDYSLGWLGWLGVILVSTTSSAVALATRSHALAFITFLITLALAWVLADVIQPRRR